jgi:hypothetical protein
MYRKEVFLVREVIEWRQRLEQIMGRVAEFVLWSV